MARHTGIRKLPNGRFRARYFQGYDVKTGERVYPARTFDTERQARDWRAEQISTRGPGLVEGRSITVGEYLDHWLATKLNIRENTRQMYRQTMDAYVKPALGHIKLLRLGATQIEQWQVDLLRRVSGSTVSSARNVLYGALESARNKGIVKSNAVGLTKGPGRSKPDLYPLTVEDALQFLNACSGRRFGLLFEFGLQTGLRPEESIGLQWGDLTLSGSRGVVQVKRVVHHARRGGGWKFSEPKTKSSTRRIVFSSELVAKLSDHRKAQLEAKLKAGGQWQNHDLVFPTSIGTPVRQPALYNYFKAILKDAGLPSKIRVYDLRHAFVTFSLVAGVDAKTVSHEAGHKDVGFTLTRYGHVLDEMHESAADKREGLLSQRRKSV